MNGQQTTVEQAGRRNRRLATGVAFVAVAMLGMAYAAVPLYRMFCQVTGFAGTTQRAEVASSIVLDKSIRIRFDANISPGLAWEFQPVQRVVDVRIGESALAFYRAKNMSEGPTVGTASFNVSPDVAGAYFNKLDCFCFTEQRLEKGETAEMPVSFFVDPAILKDPRRKEDYRDHVVVYVSSDLAETCDKEQATRPSRQGG